MENNRESFHYDNKNNETSLNDDYEILEASTLSVESVLANLQLSVPDEQLIQGDSKEYIDYIFGDTADLSLRARDISSIISALIEINDGFDKKMENPEAFVVLMNHMLQGYSMKDISTMTGLEVSEFTTKIKNYRTRTVRVAHQKGMKIQKRYEILETYVRSLEMKERAEIVREIAIPRATGRLALNDEFVYSDRAQLLADKKPFPQEGIGGIKIDSGDNPMAWKIGALCAQIDPDMFFPEKGESTREAKRICLGCDIKNKCLEYALDNGERFGIWGGLSERERRRLKSIV